MRLCEESQPLSERAGAPETTEPTKRLTIDVPMSLHQRVKSQCALKGEKMADVVRELLEKEFPNPVRVDLGQARFYRKQEMRFCRFLQLRFYASMENQRLFENTSWIYGPTGWLNDQNVTLPGERN